MKKTFLFLLLFTCGYAVAQPSEADFLLIQKDYVLHADGSSDLHYRHVVKYNTHVAFNRLYGETFIVYNPQQQQLKINESYTVQADGNKVVAPSNAFNEVLPRFAADAPDYNHLREMVVTHTGLEIGATAYLDYTLHTNAGYEPELDRCLALQEESPVKEYKVMVAVPGSKKLSFQLHGATGNPKINQKDGSTRYEWTFRNLAASSREYYQPEDGRNIPHLVFSTWASPSAALQWLAGQMKTGDTKEIKAVFDKISVKDQDDTKPNYRLDNAYKYLTNNIDYIPVPAEYTGYRLRDASQVVKQAYGTAGEKAALLLAVAKELGVEAYPVAVYPSYIDGKVGSLHAIANFAVAVNNAEKDFLLSPVKYAETNLAAFKPNWRYVAMKVTAEAITSKNCNSAVLKMDIVADMQKIKTSGYSYLESVRCETDPATGRILIDEKDTDSIVTSSGTIAVKGDNGYYSFALPEVPGGIHSWALPYLASTRLTTLEIPYPVVESYSYTLWAPTDFQFINRELSVEKKNPLGSVVINYEKRALNYYQVTRTVELHKSIISPKEYNDFMELMNAWRNPNYRTVMFK